MKVTGPGGVSGSAPASKKAGASGGAFSLPSAAAAGQSATAAPVSGPSALMGVESLLALQDAGGPLEGRRRSMRRAVRLLDVLDDLKVALIDGMNRGQQQANRRSKRFSTRSRPGPQWNSPSLRFSVSGPEGRSGTLRDQSGLL